MTGWIGFGSACSSSRRGGVRGSPAPLEVLIADQDLTFGYISDAAVSGNDLNRLFSAPGFGKCALCIDLIGDPGQPISFQSSGLVIPLSMD